MYNFICFYYIAATAIAELMLVLHLIFNNHSKVVQSFTLSTQQGAVRLCIEHVKRCLLPCTHYKRETKKERRRRQAAAARKIILKIYKSEFWTKA